jgi:hypothetical protein
MHPELESNSRHPSTPATAKFVLLDILGSSQSNRRSGRLRIVEAASCRYLPPQDENRHSILAVVIISLSSEFVSNLQVFPVVAEKGTTNKNPRTGGTGRGRYSKRFELLPN